MGERLKKRKIVIQGAPSVGKSSLFNKFIQNTFDPKYHPTIENSNSKSVKYNGVEYECEIFDTAGRDEYSILNPRHAIGIHGYILVYSTASRKSFELIKILYESIITFRGTKEMPCIIVGSKSDLEENREVQPSEGERLAKEMGVAWIETSAKNNVNVAKVFELCLAEIEKGIADSAPDDDLFMRRELPVWGVFRHLFSTFTNKFHKVQ